MRAMPSESTRLPKMFARTAITKKVTVRDLRGVDWEPFISPNLDRFHNETSCRNAQESFSRIPAV
jgi:hypothetical protein